MSLPILSRTCVLLTSACARKDLRIREDWFRHEVESHRIPQGVGVSLLRQRVQFPEAFEEHLQMSQQYLRPKSDGMMVQLCVKHSQIHPKDEAAHICALKLSVEEMRDHIASHLEQFVLTSINGDGVV